MKILRHLLILSAIFCAGCIPYRYTLQPGATGTVVDNESGVPLPNAHVVLSRMDGTWNPTNITHIFFTNQVASTASTNDGTFRISPKKGWRVFLLLPIDYTYPKYELEVEGTNYQTLKFQFFSISINHGITNFGTIKLTTQRDSAAR